jgi:type IV pilus assembly protein PilW
MQVRTQAGIGLVELMVALVLSLFLLAGLFTIFFGMRRSYNDQQALAALQNNQLLATSVLSDTLRGAGYFPYGASYASRAQAFPANTTWAAGQVVSASGTAAGPDTLSLRLIPAQATNCFGQNSSLVQVNTFKLIDTQASPHSLACTATPDKGLFQTNALVSPSGTSGINPNGGGVQNLQVKIGVAPNGDAVQQYLPPNKMTAADWKAARSAIVTLTFFNPLFDAAHTEAGANTDSQGQPRYLRMIRVIRLENLAP